MTILAANLPGTEGGLWTGASLMRCAIAPAGDCLPRSGAIQVWEGGRRAGGFPWPPPDMSCFIDQEFASS
jgi:hypothetical protein